MKKIKGLLLFGVLSLLGISKSFGLGTYLDYSTLDGGQSTYYFATEDNTSSNNGFFHFISGQPTDYSTLNTYYYRGGTIDMSFNISDYSLSSSVPNYHSYVYFNTYYNSNGNALAYRIAHDGGYSSARRQFFFPITSSFSNLSTDDSISGNGYYIRVFGNEDCLSSDVLNSSNFCIPSFVQVFNGSNITISSLGSYYDATFDGVNYNKGPIAPGVGYGYSFGFVTGSGWLSDGSNYYINTSNGDYFNFRTIDYVGSQSSSYNGIMAFKLNSSTLVSGGNSFKVLALGITGSVDDFNLIYSVYSCPSSSTSLNNCSFSYGGDTNYSHLSSSDLNTSTNFGKFLYYLTSPETTRKLNNYYNINDSITHIGDSISFFGELLYKYWGTNYKLQNTYLYSLTFVSSTGSDIIGTIPGGDGNQSTYSGSVSLNNCIDTQICYDYTGSQGNIIRMCTTECVSSGVIASGGYIGTDGTYYFVNSPISIVDSLKTDNPEYMFTGSYIDSGGILSLSYFTDYFQPGAKKVGVCPFKYYEGPLDFMTKLKIGDVYLLMPVLCFYSAFQQGKNVSFFDQYNVNDGLFSQPILYGESDNHYLLFAFFDVLFSIGLLGLIRYLSRHLF